MASIQKRTATDGGVSYRVQVRLKGHPTETASFDRLTDARKWSQQTEAAIREGRHFKTSEAKKHTMAQTIDRYSREVLALRPNPVNQKIYLKYWKATLGDYRLSDITPAIVVEHRNALLGLENKYGRKIGVATANRYSQALGHVFTVAMKEWGWINQNPLSNIAKYKEPRGRVRFLSDKERADLLQACKASDNPYLHKIVVMALSTGARKMEILNLKWQDINFENSQIVLHETKNGERRVLPLQGYALDLIRELSKIRVLGCDFVFPSKKVIRNKASGAFIYQSIDIRTAWENVLIRAEIENFRFHDLRHSAASYLAMNGASLAEIAEVLGHKTLSMVKRYAHLSEAHTHSVVTSMNERIFGNVSC